MQNRIKAALLVGSLAAGSAFAAVSPEQAAELGKTLTPMGAEMAGNADGSIPAWDPTGGPVPAGFVQHVVNVSNLFYQFFYGGNDIGNVGHICHMRASFQGMKGA